MKRSVGFWLLIFLGATVALVFVLDRLFPGTLDDPDARMQLIYRVGWLALIGSSVLAFARANPRSALRYGAIWAAIFLVVTGLFAFKNDAAYIGQRFMGALSPTQGVAHDDGTLSFDAGPDGHFRIQARVNGGRVTFMVDTGATDIVLAPDDARRIGFDPATLVFDQFAETANGTVGGAAIRLDSLIVGSIEMNRLPATVNAADMSESLLGMEFLNRLHGWRVENGVLTLVP
ncbi:MAG TPA: TIGR02281 family clan AA aspartic protease [Dongiaceae bacterium]|nr:TIGR02281 family clan AA aspartic protease [Dongiaceae bacterium]